MMGRNFTEAGSLIIMGIRYTVDGVASVSKPSVPFTLKLGNRWPIGVFFFFFPQVKPPVSAYFMLKAAICLLLLICTCEK